MDGKLGHLDKLVRKPYIDWFFAITTRNEIFTFPLRVQRGPSHTLDKKFPLVPYCILFSRTSKDFTKPLFLIVINPASTETFFHHTRNTSATQSNIFHLHRHSPATPWWLLYLRNTHEWPKERSRQSNKKERSIVKNLQKQENSWANFAKLAPNKVPEK